MIPGRNIDTDQIVPARFLKHDRAHGYGRFLFHDLRFREDGSEAPEFVLNREPMRRAMVLVADENFGCGSSREGAVYALRDFGIRAIVAPSFGDIFFNNCLKNGVVPARLAQGEVGLLRASLVQCEGDAPRVTVDLDEQSVRGPDGSRWSFAIDGFWRECLMKGLDEIELTLQRMPEIEAFEQRRAAEAPWMTAEPADQPDRSAERPPRGT